MAGNTVVFVIYSINADRYEYDLNTFTADDGRGWRQKGMSYAQSYMLTSRGSSRHSARPLEEVLDIQHELSYPSQP